MLKIPHTVTVSGLDEGPIKETAQADGKTAGEAAMILAIAKAKAVSLKHPDDLVLGADQLMQCEGRWFDKANSIEEAREQLLFLRGRTHVLETAACLYHKGEIVWQALVRPQMTMRNFSEAFLDWYVETLQDELLRSLGCYQIEGYGFQLFEKIDGDLFTIMGLPMMELMEPLRAWGVVGD
jgi:septum formation protein